MKRRDELSLEWNDESFQLNELKVEVCLPG